MSNYAHLFIFYFNFCTFHLPYLAILELDKLVCNRDIEKQKGIVTLQNVLTLISLAVNGKKRVIKLARINIQREIPSSGGSKRSLYRTRIRVILSLAKWNIQGKGLKPKTVAAPMLEIARNIVPNIEFQAVVKAEADRIVVTF